MFLGLVNGDLDSRSSFPYSLAVVVEGWLVFCLGLSSNFIELLVEELSRSRKCDVILISSTIVQDETDNLAIYSDVSTIKLSGPTSKQGDMGDPSVQTLLRMIPTICELSWTNYGHFTRPRSHEEEISRARSSLERANLRDG